VFKRDSFTCQYCGKKAPDVVLHVDHINPVKLGGTNEILNLITSCVECNSGKSAIPLNSDVVLDKQRKQLEELQDRREQIEMMFEWKKSLNDLENHSLELLVEYINNQIRPYHLNETGKGTVLKLIKQFGLDKALDAVNISQSKYLVYDEDDNLQKESVENYINKLGGIAYINQRSPIENKIHYIKGICKNRFNYWDDQRGISILKKYVNALVQAGWSDERILKDLETEASNLAKESSNWSQWSSSMEGWIEDIKGWQKDDYSVTQNQEDTIDDKVDLIINDFEIEEVAIQRANETLMFFEFLVYLSKPFGECNKEELFNTFLKCIDEYIEEQILSLNSKLVFQNDNISIEDLKPDPTIIMDLRKLIRSSSIDSGLKFYIDDLFYTYVINWFNNLYLPSMDIHIADKAALFKKIYNKHIEEHKDN
jgi:hypothetical protein